MTILVTVLGTQARETTYELDGKRIDACLAPEALVQLLPGELFPWTVVCVCTAAAAEKTYTTLQRCLGDMQPSASLRRVDIPDGLTEDEVEKAIEAIVNEVASIDDPDVIVDLTHGPRHLAAITFMLALYMNALKGRPVQHVYYANLQQNSPSPLIDLRMLLRVVDWTYAVQAFQRTGSLIPMTDLLKRAGRSTAVMKHVQSIDVAYSAGLPLELGIDIVKLDAKGLQKDLRAAGVPLSVSLRNSVCSTLDNFELEPPARQKKNISLTKSELERQHKLVDSLLQQYHYVAALALMNEWVTSWFIFQKQMDKHDWLKKDVRQKANWKLTTLQKVSEDSSLAQEMLSEDQRDLGRFLGKLKKVRNGLAHNGMRPEHTVETLRDEIRELQEFWDSLPDRADTFDLDPLERLAKGTVLVTPLGRQSGVLFSALRLCEPEPDSCIVICSQETEAKVHEAAEYAGFSGELNTVVMRDPHGGTEEIENLAMRDECQSQILASERVRVNVTGGTTVMGIAAERFAQLARDYARPVQRFALIDRRSEEEQKRDPYVEGEIVWLDEEG